MFDPRDWGWGARLVALTLALLNPGLLAASSPAGLVGGVLGAALGAIVVVGVGRAVWLRVAGRLRGGDDDGAAAV